MNFEWVWMFFEIAGTIAFAISGTLVGISKRMDIFGMTVLALATAIGGGIIRDVLVGHTPPNSMQTGLYVNLTILTSVIIFLIYRFRIVTHVTGKWVKRTYLIADNFGLASFTITGTAIGVFTYPNLGMFCVILGLITAVGGGMIRDILAQRIPSVLKEDIYAIPAIVGGIVFYYIASMGNINLASTISFVVVFVIRALALYFNWSLPSVGQRKKTSKNSNRI